jgi:hypothetical protein
MRPALHQQSIQRQAFFVTQRRQCSGGILEFHYSRVLETKAERQLPVAWM